MKIKIEEKITDRIDKYLSAELAVSRSLIVELIKNENILVNGKKIKQNYTPKVGDEISILKLEREQMTVEPEEMPINIVYEDDSLMVINKDSGVVVHPSPTQSKGTLVNGLMYLSKTLSNKDDEYRPGIVHRIDKNTSGLLMIAKDDKAHQILGEQLKEKTVTRKYIALVHGVIPENKILIDAPIGRDENDRKKMTVTAKNSKHAVTEVTVLERFDNFTLIECKLQTGRTHQIRVHMKYIGHPVVGDPEYGMRKTIDCDGQALHAKILGFMHPVTDQYMEFESELPAKMQKLIDDLRQEKADADE